MIFRLMCVRVKWVPLYSVLHSYTVEYVDLINQPQLLEQKRGRLTTLEENPSHCYVWMCSKMGDEKKKESSGLLKILLN